MLFVLLVIVGASGFRF
ncbi:sporulation protein YjcZ [Priestia aryabhattai]|nr:MULTISPECIES: sporulation protein YjcZ [Priestia]WEZ41268.1 sporulation protein YjcZ [Priestia megaterium DSM 319]